jgi:hypothetical protein
MRTMIGTLCTVLVLALSGTAGASQKCGILALNMNRTYSSWSSILVTDTTCEEGKEVAAQWHRDLLRDRIPIRVFTGGLFEYGGPFRFGATHRVGGFRCRQRKMASDVNEVWCVADDERVVGWSAWKNFVTNTPRVRDARYPTLGPEELVRPRYVPLPRQERAIRLGADLRLIKSGYGHCVRFEIHVSTANENWAAVSILPAEWIEGCIGFVQGDVISMHRVREKWRRHQYGNGGGCNMPARVRKDLRLHCW